MRLQILLLVCVTLFGCDSFSSKTKPTATVTAEKCTQKKGKIINNLSGNEKCGESEEAASVEGMDCPCICCYKK